jgi:hypothetical protein
VRASTWIFPIGAVLNVGGVFLCALLEWLSFRNTLDWRFAFLSTTFMPSLLVGTVLVIVGSFFDRRRLPAEQTKVRGVFCWIASGISFSLLASIGNVHRWTFTFIFPAFAGLVTGAILLSKPTDTRPAQ